MIKKVFFILILFFIFFSIQVSADSFLLPKAILIKASGPEVYILENNLKRWIPDPEIFNLFSYNWQGINIISDISLGYYADGDDLDKKDDFPEGSLIKGIGPEIYLIELGKRRWIPNTEIFGKHQFDWSQILNINSEKLNDIELSDNIEWSEENKYPETIILNGPKEDSILKTNKVSFKYTGENPLGANEDLDFYIYLKGHDSKWKKRNSGEVNYNLSSDSKNYTFYARAKNEQGYFDLTPAWRDFSVSLSSYYDQVEIYKIYYKKDNYIILKNNGKEKVNITGWVLINKKNEKIKIPKAAARLTFPYYDSYKSDIELGYKDIALIFPNKRSPISVDFRLNKCTGYLDSSSKFYPKLDKDCPYLDKSNYSHLTKDCRDFIDDLSRCELPDYSNNSKIGKDSQCVNFLNNNFNYSKCFEKHKKELNFFKGEWRIFLDQSIDFFDNDYDKIILKDKNNFIIDEYIYGK